MDLTHEVVVGDDACSATPHHGWRARRAGPAPALRRRDVSLPPPVAAGCLLNGWASSESSMAVSPASVVASSRRPGVVLPLLLVLVTMASSSVIATSSAFSFPAIAPPRRFPHGRYGIGGRAMVKLPPMGRQGRRVEDHVGIGGGRGDGRGGHEESIPFTYRTIVMMTSPSKSSSREVGDGDSSAGEGDGAASVGDDSSVTVTTTGGQMGHEPTSVFLSGDVNGGDVGENVDLDKGEKLRGILVLLTVPLAWGTYAPAVRYVYALDPPVPGLVFSAGYYLVASAALALGLGLSLSLSLGGGDAGDGAPTELSTSPVGEEDSSILSASSTARSSLSAATKGTPAPPPQVLGGLELGSYLFVANCLQVLGLKSVPADRAAFLVQLTTVMVPVLSAVLHDQDPGGDGNDGNPGKEKSGAMGGFDAVPTVTWFACLVAFAGVVVMGLDGEGADADMLRSLSSDPLSHLGLDGGDALVIASAVLYSLHVVRLGRYAPRTSPLALATSKAVVEAVLSVALVGALYLLGTSAVAACGAVVAPSSLFLDPIRELGVEVSRFFSELSTASIPTSSSIPAAAACLWTGLVTCAYTIYAQSYGQARVTEPADANLIYTAQPLFSAAFAYGLLGETLGPLGWVGGALIASAVWLVTSSAESFESMPGESVSMPVLEEEEDDE